MGDYELSGWDLFVECVYGYVGIKFGWFGYILYKVVKYFVYDEFVIVWGLGVFG